MGIPVVGICTTDQKLNGALLQGLGLAFRGTRFEFEPVEIHESSCSLTVVRPSRSVDWSVSFLVVDHRVEITHLTTLVKKNPNAVIMEVGNSRTTIFQGAARVFTPEWAQNADNWYDLFLNTQCTSVIS